MLDSLYRTAPAEKHIDLEKIEEIGVGPLWRNSPLRTLSSPFPAETVYTPMFVPFYQGASTQGDLFVGNRMVQFSPRMLTGMRDTGTGFGAVWGLHTIGLPRAMEDFVATGRPNYNVGYDPYEQEVAVLSIAPENMVTLLPGQAEDVFVPTCIIGVSADTRHTEAAQAFIEILLSVEVQAVATEDGFSVLRTVAHAHDEEYPLWLYEFLGLRIEGNHVISTILSTYHYIRYQGEYIAVEDCFPPQSVSRLLSGYMEELRTPSVLDEVLYEAVLDQGLRFFAGEQTAQEAAEAVSTGLMLYLLE